MNYRLYSFQNMYFAGIHAGIQTAHTIARMSQKYDSDNINTMLEAKAGDAFSNWAERGGSETIIVLNGGMAGDLQATIDFFEETNEQLGLPWDYFNESEYAANGALTNVSVVVPEHIYATAAALRNDREVMVRNSLSFDGGKTRSYLVSDKFEAIDLIDVNREQLFDRAHEKGSLPLINKEIYGETRWVTVNTAEYMLMKILNSKRLF